jgi:protein SCO1/2
MNDRAAPTPESVTEGYPGWHGYVLIPVRLANGPRARVLTHATRNATARPKTALVLTLTALLFCAAIPHGANAQLAGPLPKELEGVGITEHPNAQIPLQLEFKDDDGKTVKLGEYFKGERPVLLTLNYFRCPMLCTLQINGLVEALKNMPWTAGEQFEIVTVSFNPLETPPLARLKKQNYLKDYGRPAAAGGWHFLTGREQEIRKLTDTVGFRYRYDRNTDQYYHAACAFVCTPDGRVSRYLYGVMFNPQTLRLSLVEASAGKVGSTIDRVLLFCCQYDPGKGQYTWAAVNIMRAGGTATLLILGGVLLRFWRRELRRRRAPAPAKTQSQDDTAGSAQ